MPAVETRPVKYTRREVARCKTCKVGYQRAVLVVGSVTTYEHLGRITTDRNVTVTVDGQRLGPTACPCGRPIRFTPVKGRLVAEIECGSRCTGATGPACDCSCGGKNHGGGLAHSHA